MTTMMNEAELHRMMMYHFYRLYHSHGGSATHAIAATRLIFSERKHLDTMQVRPALRYLYDHLRVFRDKAGLWYATCGHDGVSGGIVIPRFMATGSTARAAYTALYSNLRAREYVGQWGIEADTRVDCMNALWVYMGWSL